MSEHQEQVSLFQFLSYHPNLSVIFAIPNGFYSTPAQKSKMKHEGLKNGVWDIFVPIPSRGYHGMFLEMKYGSNQLSDTQKCFGSAMEALGYRCEVAYSAMEAYTQIMDYLQETPKITCI